MFNLLTIFILLGVGISTGVGTSYLLDKTHTDLEFCKKSEKIKVLSKYNIDIAGKRCAVCNKEVTKENLSMIIPQNGNIFFICDDEKCLTLKDVAIGNE